MNPDGVTNENKLIECEIEPPNDLAGDDAEEDATLFKHFGTIKDDGATWLTVTGDWVIDTDHKHKTEIHPITSILVERPPAHPTQSRVVDFFVFSDCSDNFPDHVFHSHENRVGTFDIPVPLGTTLGNRVTIHLDMSRSKSFEVVQSSSGRFARFLGEVHSGTDDEGKGFFRATIELPGFTLITYLASRGIDLGFSLRELMRRAGETSVRALFRRLDTGGFAHS